MIQAFIGPDTLKARAAMRAALESILGKNPDALVSRFDDVAFDVGAATEALVAQNLFGGGNIILCDGLLDTPEGEEFYQTRLSDVLNTVFLRETEVKKELRAYLESVAEIHEFFPQKTFTKPETSFAIADAVGARDKKTAWVEFEKVRRRGTAMEEVHGTIFWAFKSMFIVATASRDEAIATGMKDYTYRTYGHFAKKYPVSELKVKLGELKDMYHRAHRGEGELDVLLEQFLLGI